MRAWLSRWDIPYDGLTAEKSPEIVYIDDRAICFMVMPINCFHRLSISGRGTSAGEQEGGTPETWKLAPSAE